MRLLYVENEISVAQTVEKLLHRMKYDFDTVDGGEAAVERATANAYDLILLDIVMPGIDGYEVLDKLRERGVETPVLFQTGLVDERLVTMGARPGVAGYLIKPFTSRDLAMSIETAIGGLTQLNAPGC